MCAPSIISFATVTDTTAAAVSLCLFRRAPVPRVIIIIYYATRAAHTHTQQHTTTYINVHNTRNPRCPHALTRVCRLPPPQIASRSVQPFLQNTDLLENAEVSVRVGEVERRLFEVVVDDASEVGKQLATGGGRCHQQEALSRCQRERVVSWYIYTCDGTSSTH